MNITRCLLTIALSLLVAVVYGTLSIPRTESAGPTTIALDSATQDALTKWAASRQCGYTQGGLDEVKKTIREARPEIDAKQAKYSLTPIQSQVVLNAVVASYLDNVATRSFHTASADCVIDRDRLNKAQPNLLRFLTPDSGFLTVDGSVRGAQVMVDGEPKGEIIATLIVSPGKHRWATMKCQGEVVVKPNENQRVFCDRK